MQARLSRDVRAGGPPERGGGTLVVAGTVVQTLRADARIPSESGMVIVAIAPDGKWVLLDSENCKDARAI